MLGPFDLVLTDTSLFQSLTAAIQSKKGKSVLQIDENDYYGGGEGGSFNIVLEAGHYFIYDPSPIVFYARGPLTETLLSLNLTDYMEFVAVENQFLWPSLQKLIPIPSSKEQVMLETSLSLLEKRKLSKLLNSLSTTIHEQGTKTLSLFDLFEGENVSKESIVFQLIAFGVCRCESFEEVKEISLERTIEILHAFKASVMHLNGLSPFVVPCWGSSELSQAACRRAAVNGCIQMLGKSLNQLEIDGISFKNSFSHPKCPSNTFRSCLLLDGPVLGITNGSALITVPPNSAIDPDCNSTVNILQLTCDTKCCPKGTYIIYLWSLCNFERIERSLLESSCTNSPRKVLWRTSKFSMIDNSHPVASFQNELEFIESLNLYNCNI